ncbi:hypothetical protein BCR43DRAFT_518942 [Syncephalastrum racemosum]|uniref:Uncharacterized protein n=1 Tax=Syncephalastrum racemosum TaxID=13706 RepID=A0A1X2H0G1_SYNRA|nr:hypothetical protein BCR43DRAFT_518942 [Syncephalastrum racemosum]
MPAVYDPTDVNPLLSSRPPPPFPNPAEVKDSIPVIGQFDHISSAPRLVGRYLLLHVMREAKEEPLSPSPGGQGPPGYEVGAIAPGWAAMVELALSDI